MQLTNFATLAFFVFVGGILSPAPSGDRFVLFRALLERNGIGRLGTRILGVVIVTGITVPAWFEIAPFDAWPPILANGWQGSALILFYFGGTLRLVMSVGSFRLRRELGRSSETDLEKPPAEGPALVSATVRAPDGDESEDDHLVHDYRHNMLLNRGIWEECESLTRNEPFVLEGPAGSIRVDPEDAYLAMVGDEAEEREIGDGDEITVLGTVRTDQRGRFYMSGSEDFLYLSNETPAEFRSRNRKTLYGSVLLTAVSLTIAGAALNALVGGF